MTFKDICLLALRNGVAVTIDTFEPADKFPRARVELRKDGFHIVRAIHLDDLDNEEFIKYIMDDLLWAVRKHEESKPKAEIPEAYFEKYIHHNGKMVRVMNPLVKEDKKK